MKVLKVDHVGIAVSDKHEAANFLTEILGARKVLDEPWRYRGEEFNWAYFDVGKQGRIELISSGDPGSFINRYISARGEGMHHITILVEDLLEAVRFLKSKGIRVVDVSTDHPKWKEAFIHPKDSFGVLFQLAECDEEYWMSRAGGPQGE